MSMSMNESTATVVLDGLHFGESPLLGPDGRLYLSDFYAHQVLAIDTSSWMSEPFATVPGQPSGLGWLDDGSLLVVSMRDRKLLRREPGGTLYEHADLSKIAVGAANDMYVDATGRAWIGDFGCDLYGLLAREPDADPLFGPGANPPTAHLTTVAPTGAVAVAAERMRFPNGMVQLSDGTIVVAETVGKCLTAFNPGPEGELRNRRIWADLSEAGPDGGPILPDGICVDAEDAIWVSDPTNLRAAHVTSSGIVDQAVHTERPCFAVALVQHTLVCCTAQTSNPNIAGTARTGRLETAAVNVPSQQG
ncbi:SMP-30/gluconolactonase/LRE family protein [Rhodococcus sp. 14-2470-1a]|uniref:SMP-30/gluconolactonase/LRE family protein n=1 Tax=Rhodococcus sp. 14-2470-1a TaxID=2023150 RepID=UPI000B9A2D07|nr:SMP-30/gluconolactonase/LRE family protein [Rhodococcus sp. 14-2470-1a]OZF42617.1 hypothetical protein CH292_25645 [Rhodococcus sp. 14-2470-1a]